MERAGTGGALFRNLYRDFLKESYELLELNELKQAYSDFTEIAGLWKDVAELFAKVSSSEDIRPIEQASAILKQLSVKEKEAMEKLSKMK